MDSESDEDDDDDDIGTVFSKDIKRKIKRHPVLQQAENMLSKEKEQMAQLQSNLSNMENYFAKSMEGVTQQMETLKKSDVFQMDKQHKESYE